MTVGAVVVVALIGGWGSILAMIRISGITESFGELSIRAATIFMQSDVFLLALPVLCTIPYADSFVEDFQSRFLRQYLPLAGRRRYLFSKAAIVALAGGLAVFTGHAIVLGICMALFPPMGIETGMYVFTYEEYAIAMSLVVLSAMAWALVGGIAGAALKNKYMVYVIPFIVYYVLGFFQGRYFRSAYIFSPREWIRPANLDLSTAFISVAVAVAVAFTIYCLVVRRRLYEI
ncbi:MAG: hypothetical protein FWH32_08480 [Clostridiales bacterium]|nr:hypothetical protein [Clostridiales bacterium]